MKVTWEIGERGPRILIEVGGEEWSLTTDRAAGLRDGLTDALRAVGASQITDAQLRVKP
jgi:hypothetical protein